MLDLTTPKDMRAWSRAERARGRSVGFVPTMGALHEGHLLLVDRAKQRTDRVVLSVFVNPLQFGPQEDFAKYPRDVARDTQLAAERGVDCLFVPSSPSTPATWPAIRSSPLSGAWTVCSCPTERRCTRNSRSCGSPPGRWPIPWKAPSGRGTSPAS